MRVLITGVAGLIGSKLAEWILTSIPGVKILGIDDLSCGYLENIPSEVTFIQSTLGHDGYLPLSTIFGSFKPDYVFHFASFAAEGLSPFVRKHNVRNTWLATTDVINSCINCESVKRLIFTSSMAVYGNQKTPFDEAMIPSPIDPYGIGKMACELDIKIAGEQHNLDWCIIRPHNVYGCNQNIWQDYRNVFGIWMRQILENRNIRIYGDGTQTRAFSYIDDCLPCLWESAISNKASKQIINLGGIIPVTINEAANIIKDIANATGFDYTEPRHEVKVAWSTYQKSKDILGFKNSTCLYSGLEKMWAWANDTYHKYPERLDYNKIQFEVTNGMYEWWRNK